MSRSFCADDIVARKNDGAIGVVERTFTDLDTHEHFVEDLDIESGPGISRVAFQAFLASGIPPKDTVLVRWRNELKATLTREATLDLIDRSLLIGDVVKKSVRDAMSGVVVNTTTRCTLRPMCELRYKDRYSLKGILPPSGPSSDLTVVSQPVDLIDVPVSELVYAEYPTEEDLIIYKDWIGRVVGVLHSVVLKLTDNCVVEISDELLEHVDMNDGPFCAGDVAFTKKGHMRNGRWIYGQYNANIPPVGTVVQVRLTQCRVDWLQQRLLNASPRVPPDVLERDELESDHFRIYDKTVKPRGAALTPDGLGLSTDTLSYSEMDARLSLRVRFRDLTGACAKYDDTCPQGQLNRIDRQETLGYDLNVFDIHLFRTEVTVQWQDLTMTTEDSVDLLPDLSIDDEHAAWPGEIVHTLELQAVPNMPQVERPSRVGVVQSVNSEERMAKVRWCPGGVIDYTVDPDDEAKSQTLVTGKVDIAQGEVQEISLYEIEAPGGMNVRRGDIVLLANKFWIGDPSFGTDAIDWLGEVADTLLDGRLIVRLGALTPVRDVVVRREDVVVGIRSDDSFVMDEAEMEDFEDWSMQSPEAAAVLREVQMYMGGEPDESIPHAHRASVSDWDMDERVVWVDEHGQTLNEDDVQNGEWESDMDDDGEDANDMDADEPDGLDEASPQARDPGGDALAMVNNVIQNMASPQYAVLDLTVPSSHRFAREPATETAAHMKRTQKEHRMLSSNGALPPGVYVRSWESRLDLLRVLLIGPDDSPYRNAPFVIDLHLGPKFPSEPPAAFFHSWQGESGLGGVGRVNPNLYEDGNICLSLLGTWSGNQGESWSATQSTLLQVIVSVLGLVLVKEPYYNEAGYEHLVGLESSKRASALYSERVYLRARTFVLTGCRRVLAMQRGASSGPTGLEGLEDVLDWLFWSGDGPRLFHKNIEDLQQVLSDSEAADAGEPDGYKTLSKGVCIPLRKVLGKLRELEGVNR